MKQTPKHHTMHGLSRHRINRIYHLMRARCKPNHARHHRYYDRGITVCEEWLNSFVAFATWAMANGYREDLTLDRIDNDKGYSPDNCRWVTPKEQSNNMRRNHYLSFNGERHTISEWSQILGISRHTLSSRVKAGWDDERIITTPVNNNIKGVCL